MSRISGGSMLRTRRKDVNVKPNRRLDRKSSRGMIYENEELRLRTININAEVERGQSDIKKLRRENEQLRREIWSLREEYDRLDNLLRNGQPDASDVSESESEEENQGDSYSEDELEDQESAENDENAQKTKHKGLRVNFDHLSIVSEENTTNSDSANAQEEPGQSREAPSSSPKTDATRDPTSESTTTGETVLLNGGWDFNGSTSTVKHDMVKNDSSLFGHNDHPHNLNSHQMNELYLKTSQNYDASTSQNQNMPVKHFFSPMPPMVQQTREDISNNSVCTRGGPDVFVQNFHDATSSSNQPCRSVCSFQTGGNLEDLLMDIETTSNDANLQSEVNNLTRYKSEINVFLQNPQDAGTPPIIPEPMMLLPKLLPYIGFEKLTDFPSTLPQLGSAQTQATNATSQPISSSSIPTYANDEAPITTPANTANTTNLSATSNASETAQNVQNTEHLKTKCQSPATRRRLYAANNKLQQVNDRKVAMPPETYHAVRQRLGSISSSSDKMEQKTDPTKKSRRVSIYFSGMKKKKSDANENHTDNQNASDEIIQPHKTENRKVPKIKISDNYRSKSGKLSSRRKSGHDGGHSSMYSTTQESCPEATTSHSERNSLASSRESSTSLSMRSHKSRRKLSSSSIHNGKIPWCACWGNGCL